MRLPRVLAPIVVASFAFAGGAAGESSAAETLKGIVGPGFTISLKKADGSTVTRLEPGTYTFEIQDLSDMHNFHLNGPGVDKVAGATWTVTLASGTYTFLCDPHPSSMTRTFTVGTTTSAATPVKLSATVSSAGAVRLTKSGTKATTLAAGVYRIAVRDRAADANFHLTGPGINRKTSVQRKSFTTWNVTLKAGRYTYRSDSTPTVKGSVAVKTS